MQPDEYEAILETIPHNGMVLEVGTFHGLTVSNWALQRPNTIFFSIDPLHWERSGLKWYENRRSNMRLLTGTTSDLETLKVTALFDVIFIDGDHDYLPCYRDLNICVKLIKSDGTLAVHDYAKGTLRRTTARAVVRAVRDFCRAYNYRIKKVVNTTAFLEKNMCPECRKLAGK
ncbi:MAG: class I SAM-dependent methyltransferase [Candidatus Cloacimonetes bacterium]|nr:class I SAM-dependent methyltransferase [Candidatus Cloacimonadota bacterium]